MCGISGWLDWNAPPEKAAVEKITDALVHRGPDASGVKALGPVVLGHRRLSIIDCTPANDQPLSDLSGKFWIVFNGEIYNFQELREQLTGMGASFRTHGDTEVVLEAYKQWGTACVEHFNGMFAFALWDSYREQLFLARDRMGEKPLYYFQPNPCSLVFASEPQALTRNIEACRKIDPVGLSYYLALNYTLGERCLFEGVRQLPPAHCMVLKRDQPPHTQCYWDLSEHFQNKRSFKKQTDATDELNWLIADSVRIRMISDVPLGAFLSGGIDSSTIVAAMAALGNAGQTKTFSIGFREANFSELKEARSAAEFLKVDHYERLVTPDPELFIKVAAKASSEPLADTSFLPTYCLAEFARQQVKVALSGDGGDECFAGYETYVADRLHRHLHKLPGWLTDGAMLAATNLLPVSFKKVSFDYKVKHFLAGLRLDGPLAHSGWRNIFEQEDRAAIVQPHLRELMRHEDPYEEFSKHFQRVKDCQYLDQCLYVDMKTWLPDDILLKVDRATMAHSLESRAPFLDHRLVEFSASLPAEFKLKGLRTKHILKESQTGKLPDWLLNRPKKGFNAPVSNWFAGPLQDLAGDVFKQPCMQDWFNSVELNRLLDEHRRCKRDHGLKLLSLMLIGLWLQNNSQTATLPLANVPVLALSEGSCN